MTNPNCKYLPGTVVRKNIKRKQFLGEVVDYVIKEGSYKILFEDGNGEDLNVDEMEKYLYNPNKKQKKKKCLLA